MTIHYPNGKLYRPKKSTASKSDTPAKKKINYSKRGMSLEQELNDSNEYYLATNRAVIHKKPIPVQVVNVHYPKRSAAVITEAYYRKASTTDYNGLYRGYYLDFEAKETKNQTLFPLKNFHEHQIVHMRQCSDHGGIVFVIILFSFYNELYLIETKDILPFWDDQDTASGRKSIPLDYIRETGYKLNYSLAPRIPYLEAVDQIIEKHKQ
ncbi:Holliday junction resolvase RecU [Lacticigenium naphthae]|uniref:Holliday junction resolvase RecU n=1 Tax=Lacticigenium naphthae TaxID=515351 RepID=UPI00040148D2|nr:Holliday junction resolvase RecU [Lacticigenium naphthae]